MKAIKNIFFEYKKIIEDLRFGFKRFIKFQIATKMLITLVFIPIINLLINSLMKNKGVSTLANNQLFKFIISPQGILLMLLLIIIMSSIILIEVGGLVVLSHQIYLRKEESSYLEILKYCLFKIPRFKGVGGVLVLLNITIFTSMLRIGLSSNSINISKIPDFIMDYIYSNNLITVLYSILVLIVVVLSIRWIFSMNFIMLENNSSYEAIRNSGRLVSRNLKVFLKQFIGITLMNIFISLFLLVLWMILVYGLIKFVGIEPGAKRLILAFFKLFQLIIVISLSFLLLAFETQHYTRLYYKLYYNDISKIIVPLKLKERSYKTFLNKLFKRKRFIFISFVIILGFLTLVTKEIIDESVDAKYSVDITAHRGSSKEAPENSMLAIRKAIDNKADYAEIDVQETRDGNIVLIHDSNLKRLTGVNDYIWNLDYDYIKTLDISYGTKEYSLEENIPLLKEVLELSKSKIKLNIEIKPNNDNEETMARKVLDLIKAYNMEEEVIITSMNYDVLQKVKDIDSNIKTGYIMYAIVGDYEKLNVDLFSVEESFVTKRLVREAHRLEKEVHVWLVNNEDGLKRLIDLGVDNIITDEDEYFLSILEEEKEKDYFSKFLEFMIYY